MNRRMLGLAIISFYLMLAMAALQMPVDAAPATQLVGDTEPSPDEAAPLAQPISVSIRHQIPVTLTISLPQARSDALSTVLTETLALTLSDALTEARAAGQTDSLTDTITSTLTLPPVELTDELPAESSQTGVDTSASDDVTPITATVPLTLDVGLQFALTQTLTSTVAASVTLTFPDGFTLTLPVSFTLASPLTATVVTTALTPLPESITAPTPTETPEPESLEPTATLTPTTGLTETAPLTATVTPTDALADALPPLTSSVNITANLRGGPGTDFPVVGQGSLGQPVAVMGVSADGGWYLLSIGAWIANTLVDNAPANPPVATEPLIASVQATATAVAEANIPATPAPPPAILLPTPTPTPPPADQPTVAPSVTVNANLRSGPGLEFPQIGGTIAGQTINIVARDDAGEWFLLDNGGWVAAFLVANAPDVASVPVFDPNAAAPAAPEPAPEAAPITETAPITTPTTVTPTTAAPVTLGVLDNLYIVDATELIARYERSLAEIDRLVTQAGQNESLLEDAQWIQSMTTALALVRATDTRVRTLQPSPLLADAHADLVRAADAYAEATTLLTQGVDQRSPDSFDAAFAQITLGDAALDSASGRIQALTQ